MLGAADSVCAVVMEQRAGRCGPGWRRGGSPADGDALLSGGGAGWARSWLFLLRQWGVYEAAVTAGWASLSKALRTPWANTFTSGHASPSATAVRLSWPA